MRFQLKIAFFLLLAVTAILHLGCKKDPPAGLYKTKNVVVIVVDGARYTETWGNSTHQYIPHRASMLQQGVLCSAFYNEGYTYTNPGHTAIATGVYQDISNNGSEYPVNPSFMQLWLKASGQPADKARIVTSKDKLEVLSDCSRPDWHGRYRPAVDCGISGAGSGYREDSVTFDHVKTILNTDHPRLLLINFKQPDAAGHAANYSAYLRGITDTDNYVYQIWQLLQNDPFYKDQTTLFVTNDHGRHSSGHLDGFISHGDRCEGCKHIELFAIGPDFKQNYNCSAPYSQIDLASTVAGLMGFEMPYAKGKIIADVFKRTE